MQIANKSQAFFNNHPELITEIRQGIERECLRVAADGKASATIYPAELGHKLTHPYITTDFSENLMEFITAPKLDTVSLLSELDGLHGYTLKHLKNEFLWTNSMPAELPIDDEIPLAYYGESNVGKLKTLYRKGLGNRYGRSMQTIAGIHYNFSYSDHFWQQLKDYEKSDLALIEFKNEKYFHMIRNFKRHSWMLMYLFGASPAVDKSFLENKKHNLIKMSDDTFYTPEGISLRMGGLGYTSQAQKDITICFDRVESYIKTIEKARLQSYPEYEQIGLKENGAYKQLNTNLLQIDNEFYSTIRPKNVAKSRESALMALHKRGVEYIEVRLLDVDPFSPTGIGSEQIHFMHLFLNWCLVSESALLTDSEYQELDENFERIVTKGRAKNLKIVKGEELPLKDCLQRIFEEMKESCSSLISQHKSYQNAFNAQWAKIDDITLIPSNRLMTAIESTSSSFSKFSLEQAKNFSKDYKLKDSFESMLVDLSQSSVSEAQKIKENDKLDFDNFLIQYFSDIKINYA